MNHENMKMTEVGWIPKDWEVKELCEVANLKSGKSIDFKTTPSGSYPCFGGNGIRCYLSIYSHDGLFPIIGRQGELCGNVNFANGKFYATEHAIVCTPKKEISPTWLFHVLDKADINQHKTGNAQPGISVEKINHAVILPIPPTSEQRRIAQVLSDTDSLIASLSRTIEKKRLVKQGAMQQLLTGKTRLKGFSGEWVEKELGEVGKTIRGVGFTPEQSSLTPSSNSIPLLRSNNIQKQTIVLNDLIYVDKSCVANRQIMNYGDILICAANGSRNLVGKSSMYKSAFQRTFGAFMCVFRCLDKFQSAFVSYLFQSDCYKEQLDEILTGSAINNLNGSQIEALRFFVPQSVDEQQAIANILTTIDNEIASLEAELQKYKALKQGMMQKLLTGQIRLVNTK